jgi:hypothetical protein
VAALAAISGCGSDEPSDRESGGDSVTVHPERIGPKDSIELTFPTPYVVGDMTRNGKKAGRQEVGPRTAQAYDNYHVVARGPGKRSCEGEFKFGFGYTTLEKRAKTRTVTIKWPGATTPAAGRPKHWCPGRYTGYVAYFQPDRSPGIPPERFGEFAFTVERGR